MIISFTQVVVVDHLSLFIEAQEAHVPAKQQITVISSRFYKSE